MKQPPEFFRIGFQEAQVGTLVNVEAYCDPHDSNLVAQISPHAMEAQMDTAERRAELCVRLADLDIQMVGDFASTRVQKWMEAIALLAARSLKKRYTEAEQLKTGIADLIVQRVVPNHAEIDLPLRIILKEGTEDTQVILEDGQKPIILHTNVHVEGGKVVIHVPTLPQVANFRDLGTELRQNAVRTIAAETLNAHGLFTRT